MPVIVAVLPTIPLVGLKLLIGGVTRKTRLLFSVFVNVVTVTVPVSAPAGERGRHIDKPLRDK
jgi:hypothetical protein